MCIYIFQYNIGSILYISHLVVYRNHSFHIYLYIQGHLDSLFTVPIVTSPAVNTGHSSPFDMLILFVMGLLSFVNYTEKVRQ